MAHIRGFSTEYIVEHMEYYDYIAWMARAVLMRLMAIPEDDDARSVS